MIIHEVQQLMYVNTTHGMGIVLFLIDYGPQANTIWVVANEKDGVIRHYDSNQVTLSKNCTIELNLNDK
jgi:hypothetical protein